MKEYNYAIAPTSQFYFCGLPFRLDLKPKCDLNCAYCFAMSRGGRRTDTKQIINVDHFSKLFSKAMQLSEPQNIVQEMLLHRMPIHLGGMSDPFSDEESAEVFDKLVPLFIDEIDYPIVVSTKKPSELLKRKVFLEKKNLIIQISLPIIDNTIQKRMEPFADSVQERLSVIQELVSVGKNVSCRIQPIFPQFIVSIKDIIDNLSAAGCSHVVLEYLKLPVERDALNTEIISKILNVDILSYYKENGAKLVGREWLLPTEYRYKSLLPIKQYANEQGIAVSFGDYGLYHLGDCLCCCGIDYFGIDCSWNSGNFTTLIKSKKGLLFFSDLLDYWHPEKSISRYVNSRSRLNDNTMLAYLRNRWNRPGTANAPDSYYGVKCTGLKDVDENYIYDNQG